MNARTKIASGIALAFVVTACSRATSPPSGARTDPIAVGDRAPTFALQSANGGTVSLSDYAGKPVLLYFSMGPG
jgi:cytochrome oxidase Cu insertion factor (SCO1/SenC/PrrC family)